MGPERIDESSSRAGGRIARALQQQFAFDQMIRLESEIGRLQVIKRSRERRTRPMAK
jgi:hypothetical protein